MTAYPEVIQPGDDKSALERRMNGEPFSDPAQAGPALSNVIMKACSYQSASRYPTASLMKKDLAKIKARLSEAEKNHLSR